jgi:hypothetical protein
LGSGSDYSPFFQHLGIPSLNIGFGGEDPGGEYHSIYDTYDNYKRFKDPKFEYGVALAKARDEAVCVWPMQKYCHLIFVLYKKPQGHVTSDQLLTSS